MGGPGGRVAQLSRRRGERLGVGRNEAGIFTLAQQDAGSARERRLLQMLAYQIDAGHQQKETGSAFLARLMESPMSFQELGELAEVLSSRNVLPARSIPGMEDLPLCLHASYGVREILTAVSWLTDTRRSPFQAGVLPLLKIQKLAGRSGGCLLSKVSQSADGRQDLANAITGMKA